jgi:hypothetical protein
MGHNIDYYKPAYGETMCAALRSNDRFLWASSKGGKFVAPVPYNIHSGGSQSGWPSDGRKYLPFWSQRPGTFNDGKGGCCHLTKYDKHGWGRAFKIYLVKYKSGHRKPSAVKNGRHPWGELPHFTHGVRSSSHRLTSAVFEKYVHNLTRKDAVLWAQAHTFEDRP